MPVLSPPCPRTATPIRLLVATLAALLLASFAASPARAADAGPSLSPASPQAGDPVTAIAIGTDNPTAASGWTVVGAAQWAASGITATVAAFPRRVAYRRAWGHGPDQEGQRPGPAQKKKKQHGPGQDEQQGSNTGSANAPPTGNFTWSPSAPRTGQNLKLTASGSDPDGTITAAEWDLDGNGSYADAVDGVGPSTTVRFNTPGQHVVNLRLTDDRGSTTVVTQSISVDSPPTAGFTWSPGTPEVGQAVTFTSTSSDPSGSVAAIDWDLDGEGKLNDAHGASVQRAFSAPGAYNISVRATDNTGFTAVATQRITVVAASPPPNPGPGTSPPAKPPRTALNAIVRLSGVITSRGARIMRLTVKGPPGASVTARCRGRGCPLAPKPLLITAKRATVHLRSLERTLPAGSRITVVVTRSDRIGKYTRFTIRRNKSPARRDMCITGRRITKCPL